MQGLTFREIARRITTVGVAHGRVVRAMNLVPLENAREALTLELARLDAYLATYHAAAVGGDLHAAELALKISHHRARILGLYPESGRTATILMAAQNGEVSPLTMIEFVVPGHHNEDDEPPPRPIVGQLALPPPPRRVSTEFGMVDRDPPSSPSRPGDDWMR